MFDVMMKLLFVSSEKRSTNNITHMPKYPLFGMRTETYAWQVLVQEVESEYLLPRRLGYAVNK